jgi:hypothetical protein
MSKRAIEHDLRLLECTTNIKKCFTLGGTVLVASNFNLDVVNRAIMLVFSSVQEIEDRLKSDHSKHLVAQKSVLGWKIAWLILLMQFVVSFIPDILLQELLE